MSFATDEVRRKRAPRRVTPLLRGAGEIVSGLGPITGAIWDRGLPSFPVCSCLSVKSLWWVAAAVHERLDGDLREGSRLAVHLGDLAHFEVRPDVVRHVGELTRIGNAHGVGGFVFGADDWSASRSCAASRSRGSMVSISTEDGRFSAGTIIVVDTRR
jgi:hypothetical protein